MLGRDTDHSDLCGLEPARRLPRSVRKWFETFVILGGLVGGGMGLGYWAGIQQERADRIAEIERLRQAYAQNITTLSGRVGAAATTAATAAETAADAATRAGDAAQIAAKAAGTGTGKPSSSRSTP